MTDQRPEQIPDPWADAPRWSADRPSEGAPGPEATDALAGATAPAPVAAPASAVPASHAGPAACAWCGTPAPAEAARCASCGAALAQRESIGDLLIPGLTAVDPALKDLDGRPLHISGPSPSQGAASGIAAAAAAGGPLGLAILGGVGAIAAAEYLGARRETRTAGNRDVGQVSGAVQQALERLERGESIDAASQSEPVDP